ncbi:hypothetical protein JCM3765_005425 [Sporobolomyces pararoseus]
MITDHELAQAASILEKEWPSIPSRLAAAEHLHRKSLFNSTSKTDLSTAFVAISKDPRSGRKEVKVKDLGKTGRFISDEFDFEFKGRGYRSLQLLEAWYQKTLESPGDFMYVWINHEWTLAVPPLPSYENEVIRLTLIRVVNHYQGGRNGAPFSEKDFTKWFKSKKYRWPIPADPQKSIQTECNTHLPPVGTLYLWRVAHAKELGMDQKPTLPAFLKNVDQTLRDYGFLTDNFSKLPSNVQDEIAKYSISALLFDRPSFTKTRTNHISVLRGVIPPLVPPGYILSDYVEKKSTSGPPTNSLESSHEEAEPPTKRSRHSSVIQAVYNEFGTKLDRWVPAYGADLSYRLTEKGRIDQGGIEPGFTYPEPSDALLNFPPADRFDMMAPAVADYLNSAPFCNTDAEYDALPEGSAERFERERVEFEALHPDCSVVVCGANLHNFAKYGATKIYKSVYDPTKGLCQGDAMLAVLLKSLGISEEDFYRATLFTSTRSIDSPPLRRLLTATLRCLGTCMEHLFGQHQLAFLQGVETRFGTLSLCNPCFSCRDELSLSVDKEALDALYDQLEHDNPDLTAREIRLLMPKIEPFTLGQIPRGLGPFGVHVQREDHEGKIVCTACLAPAIPRPVLTAQETRTIVSALLAAGEPGVVDEKKKPIAVLNRFAREYKGVGTDPFYLLKFLLSDKAKAVLNSKAHKQLRALLGALNDE